MTTEDKRLSFPKTNREFFRFVLIYTLAIAAVVFIAFLALGTFWARVRWRSDDFLYYGAISLIAGLGVTRLLLIWLKGRDKRT